MREPYNHYEYIAALVGNLRATQGEGHFAQASGSDGLEAIFAALPGLRYPLVIADADCASTTIDRGSDNPLRRTIYQVYIMDQATPGDGASLIAAKRRARAIADELAAALLEDSQYAPRPPAPMGPGPLYQRLERESLTIVDLGKMRGDAGYGVGLGFSIVEPAPRRDPSQWL